MNELPYLIVPTRTFQAPFLRDLNTSLPGQREIMRGLGATLFALALVAGHEATGFVAPLSTLSIGGTSRSVCGVRRSSSISAPTRLHMSTPNLPKFSVSLTDDARVTFHLDKETLKKLAQQVRAIRSTREHCITALVARQYYCVGIDRKLRCTRGSGCLFIYCCGTSLTTLEL